MRYVKSIGLNSNQQRGRGFNHPYDIAFSSDERIYVLNRMYPQSSDGIRVQICDINDEWYGEFGHGPGYSNDKFLVPVCMVFDRNDRLYVTDESLNQIKIFDKSGELLDVWGANGSKLANLNGPSGISLDGEDHLLIVEQYKGVIKRIDLEGNLVSQFGGKGSGAGEFELPWGISTDKNGDIYVADWRNDRVERFDEDGKWILSIGSPGQAEGQLHRPSSVCVTSSGVVVVADWGNERVQLFDTSGNFKSIIQGDADLSKWSLEWLDVNQDELSARKNSNLKIDELPDHLSTPYHRASQIEHIFWGPVSVKLDQKENLYVTEHSRHRIQIFENIESVVSA